MKPFVLALLLTACTIAATAQTAPKPAAPAAAAHHPAAVSSATKLPPGVPPVRGIIKTGFTLRYEEIKIGAGAEAEPNKLYKVFYTGWLGNNGRPDDGHKFDSSYDHPGPPLKDKDGKPVLDEDGKPKLGEPQPLTFPQGMGKLIPGFDDGFYGMRIGGKRRIFIPWQLAYGPKGRPGPDAAHPGIPPKSNLIFDVELVDTEDLPMPPGRPGMGQMPRRPMPGMNPNSRPGAAPMPGRPVTVPPPSTPGTAPATSGTAPATSPTTVPVPSTPPPTTAPAPPTQTQPQK